MVTDDRGQCCPVCTSTRTYWIFSAVDGDAWDCGSCGYQWTVEEAYAKASLKKYRPTAARNEDKKVFSGLL